MGAVKYEAANAPPKNEELDELGRKSEELLERSRERRAGYKLIESDIVKEGPEPVPQAFKDVSTTTWQFSQQSFSPRSIVSVNGAREDIMKQREPIWPFMPGALPSVTESARTSINGKLKSHLDGVRKVEKFNSMPLLTNGHDKQNGPTVTETVQRFEETRRTEEVERRVQRREKRERRSRHHSSSRHQSGYNDGYHHHEHHQFHRTASMPRIVYKSSNRAMNSDEIDKIVREAYEAADEARRDADKRGYRSSSLSRSGHAGYLPASNETYYKREATRREHHSNRGGGERYEDEFGGRGLAHARYGSLSDSLRRGELKYIPNGDVRESYYRNGDGRNMHKSYSTRDVFSGGHEAAHDHRSASSMRRGSQQASPFVEYPPSLPRRAGREDYYSYKPVSKSRSYADWDDAGRAGFGKEIKRYDDDMTRLEAEFRDSLLMPMPNGNVNDREHRTEQIPGGYETFHKDNRANSGRRAGRDGRPVDFNEATQEYSYKREQEFDDRRRR
ncbi:hypothetical protein WR25_18968 [Diploscapter pachys]|uniref:Uncharacterized protein n=1 Tax=Diploscapter pachys TaxID=2018661 RepID=A0A2A2M045_9BILA|nr:hypothetical protein WR25_18968 [Diploscapter pachys]